MRYSFSHHHSRNTKFPTDLEIRMARLVEAFAKVRRGGLTRAAIAYAAKATDHRLAFAAE